MFSVISYHSLEMLLLTLDYLENSGTNNDGTLMEVMQFLKNNN